MFGSQPAEFPGTAEEKRANYQTHWFYEDRCEECDCRPWGRYAQWPCGAEVPRVAFQTREEAIAGVAGFAAGAAVFAAVEEGVR